MIFLIPEKKPRKERERRWYYVNWLAWYPVIASTTVGYIREHGSHFEPIRKKAWVWFERVDASYGWDTEKGRYAYHYTHWVPEKQDKKLRAAAMSRQAMKAAGLA